MSFDADNADLLWPLNTEPPIASILMDAVTVADLTTSLALMRTREHHAGSALIETSNSTGKLVFVQNISWKNVHNDTGPAVLKLDAEDTGDLPQFERTMDMLQERIVARGAAWGLESYERFGDCG